MQAGVVDPVAAARRNMVARRRGSAPRRTEPVSASSVRWNEATCRDRVPSSAFSPGGATCWPASGRGSIGSLPPCRAAAGPHIDPATLELVARASRRRGSRRGRRPPSRHLAGATYAEAAKLRGRRGLRVVGAAIAEGSAISTSSPGSRGMARRAGRRPQPGTTLGRVSFSVRWHGPRPALLWERTGGEADVELQLRPDGEWHTHDREGEGLLPSAPPER
ncbi:MAG: hypothetical protein R2695_01760 [Acidimicrobiales bacterium]